MGAPTIAPVLKLTLAVDKSAAIPGDTLTYSSTVTNTGATLAFSGTDFAQNNGNIAATVSAYYDDLEYYSTASKGWVALAGTAASTGTPVVTPPIKTGMTFSATGVTANGVTYPSSGDPILGTQINTTATAAWNFQASVSVTPSLIAILKDPTKVNGVRNVIHLEVSPRAISQGQPFNYRNDVTNLFQSQSAAATNVSITINPPSGSPVQFTSSTTAGLTSIAPGAAVSVTSNYRVPVAAPKGASEIDNDYLTRLENLNGSSLQATASAAGSGPSGTVRAPAPAPVTTTEQLPIVTISKSGPATSDAGTSESNPLALQNAGLATASALIIADSLPGGGSGTVTGAPATLAAGANGSAQAIYPIPASQPEGGLTDTAGITWQDANGNAYGPVSSSWTTQVKSTLAGATLVLSPASAGPDLTGASQVLTATLLDRNRNPIANQSITFAVTGVNQSGGSAITDTNGVATFTYHGANGGTDVAQATFTSGSFSLQSNTSTITWITPVATVGTTPVQGNFYAEASSACSFVAQPGNTPAFGQSFPSIEFNPPAGIVPHNISGVGPSARPFTDVTTDLVGNFSGTTIAQGNGVQAGVGTLSSFDALFTGSFTVAKAGDVTFNVIADDAFLLGVGGGATRVSGAYENPPSSNTSPFNGYPLVGAWNQQRGSGSDTYPVTVHFAAPGTYPYELDYAECGGGDLTLTMTVQSFTADTSPLSVYVGYADGLRPGGSVFPFPWQGSPSVVFIGGGTFDAGAVRLDNNSDNSMTFDSITVDIGGNQLDIWPHSTTLPAHEILILTQTFSYNFDTSDFSNAGCGGNNGVIPVVNVIQAGTTSSFKDSTQVLNTRGFDLACQGNESTPWTRIGGGGTAINVPLPPAVELSLTPTMVTGDVVGQSQRLTAAALDGSGQPVANLSVAITISGVNARQLSGTTNSAGVVTLSYTGANPGTDTMTASAFIDGLRAVSNLVTVSWNIPLPAPPPPASTGTAPPTISNLTPLDGTTVAARTAIKASITAASGSTIASWSVTDQLLPSGAVETLASANGTPSSSLATFDPIGRANGTYALVVSATSSAGGSASAGTRLIVGSGGGSVAQSPPTIGPTSPLDGTVITSPVAVTDSIAPPAGESITSWSVTLTPASGGASITIGSGSGSPPATLATLDPSLLANGNYLLTVSATASGGGTQMQTTAVSLTGTLKPGRLVATYQDMSVPVAGMAMQVRRTYDSYATRPGDFGTGWQVELSNITLSDNGPLGDGGWSATPVNCVFGLCFYKFTSSRPHDITVTYTDGHTDVFDLTPLNGGPIFYWTGTAAYSPRSGMGNTSTLAPDPSSAGFLYGFDGNLYDDSGNFYDPQRFQLTTRDGRVLTIDRALGLVAESDPSGNTITVDANGVHSSNGPSITFTRDAAHGNRITEIAGPDDGVNGQDQHFLYGYDAAGNLARVTDPNNNTVTYAYDPTTGKLKGSTDPAGQPIQTLTYGPDGRLATIANGNQPPTTLTTAPGANQQVVLDANGKLTTVYIYDLRGDVIEKDQTFNGHTVVTKSQYDAAGRMTDLVDASGHSHWVYDETATANGNLLSYTDPVGRIWQYSNYDSHGHAGTIIGPDNATTAVLAYDPKTGRLLTTQQPGLAATTFSYYSNGLLKTSTDPDGRTTTYTYNAAGFKTSQSDSQGRIVYYTPDAAGRVTAVTDQLGNTTHYVYDGMGNLTNITDPNHVTHTFHYNARGMLDQAADGALTTGYGYNDLGLVSNRTDRNGVVTTYQYDVHGKLVQETRPNNDVTNYQYDSLERLGAAENSSGEITFTYDDAGHLTGQTSCAPQPALGACQPSTAASAQPTVSLVYGWTPDGLPQSVTGPDGTTSYGYDGDGRLASVTDAAHQPITLTYDAHSRLIGYSLPDGISDSIGYDAAGQLQSRDASWNGTTVSRADYTSDPVTGLRTSLTDLDGSHTFAHLDNGALQSASHPSASGLASESYTYDAAGNRTSWNGAPASSVSYDSLERLASAGSTVFAYDGEGDVVSRTISGGTPTVYHWNADHQLMRIDYPNGGFSTYKYDPLGRRIESNDSGTITRFVWDGFNVHADYSGSNNQLAAYTLTPSDAGGKDAASPAEALEVTRGGVASFYLHDGLNSTVATADATGTVTARYRYDTFGRPANSNGPESRYTYTGAQYDSSSGLYYLHDRYYDPSTGRFLSQDPLASQYYNVPLGRFTHRDPTLDVTLPATLNLYAYATNDPVDYADPNGDGLGGRLLAVACIVVALAAGAGQTVAEEGTPLYTLSEAASECLQKWAEDKEAFDEAQTLIEELAQGDSEAVAADIEAGIAEEIAIDVEIEVEIVEVEIIIEG